MSKTNATDTPLPSSPAPVDTSITDAADDNCPAASALSSSPPSTPKATPKKRGANDTSASEPPAKKAETRASGERNGPPAPAKSRATPRCFDDCDEQDKRLLTLRDAGTTWARIRAEWERATGERVGNSTLPNRYTRLKSAFTVLKHEDCARLLEAKREIEQGFQREKWGLVAKAVAAKGGDVYLPDALQRQYKVLMTAAGAVPPPGVRDGDFEIDGED